MEAQFWNGKRAPGVSDTINLDEYDSVVEVIESAFKRYADRPAFTSIGHTLSYRDIDNYSAAFASYLQNHTTLKAGDRIAIQMPNILQFPIAMYGALRAGMVVVNTNPLYTEREMLHQFNDSGAKALVCMDVFARSVQNVLKDTGLKHVIVTSLADMLPQPKRTLINFAAKHVKKMVPGYSLPDAIGFRKTLKLGARAGHYRAEHLIGSQQTIILQYTGGTTGVAKGAELTNQNLIANMQQARSLLMQIDASGKPIKPEGGAKVVAPLPLYHIYAFTVHLMALFEMGDQSILIANPRDTGMFVRMIKPHKLTGFVGLNTLFVSLMNHPEFKNCDFSELKLTLSGGTALVADTAKRWKELTGSGISEGYGLTECSPVVCVNPTGGLERLGTVGQPVPGTALKCIDDQGNEVAIGERGELCVKGPQVMKGYWNRPESTAESFTPDGQWLRTGDVAVIDEDGFVKIVDRIKDMVLVSGFNVYPNEIEDVVATHPGVENCAVIGVPDVKTGEAVKLFVVAIDKNLTADDIMAHCRLSLTGYKLPRHIEFRDELPMTPVGKILRRELKDEEAAKRTKEATPA
ncbi:MAG: AMP-binding protein [Thalassolituus oleivorans]|uniref:AMP-binding protein n=1 Tax=Thalassolituus oleivorans TaxID=187493 RepID=UPI001B551F0F|nr:AMP-binding protein [Thalassolituus oleivorans]MBQ0728730.1 AMP-binding protein [Thalassolituus oleivorans]MBQ0779760.1 AMP-binding protein [Thalassolituus oleivorans]